MSDMTRETLYVKIIKDIYGASIYVDESMITDEVIAVVNTMLNEIRTCNLRLATITTTVNALAEALHEAWKTFGVPDLKQLVEDFFDGDTEDMLNKQIGKFGADFVYSFVEHWFYIITNQRQARICLVSASRNYKSALAIALLGL